jgi:MerR family transcriptional regulator, heat shock protein HspR
MKRKKGYFSISAVSDMFSVHQQTIRLYEKEGLICPKRSEGNTRLFSEEDVNRLEEIIYLTHKLGINLAGVEMILKQKKQIAKMQEHMNKMFTVAQQELDEQSELAQKKAGESIKRIKDLKEKAKKEGSTTTITIKKD